MSFLFVPERMLMCFTLYIVSSPWKVPEKSIALLFLLVTKTDGVPLSHFHLLIPERLLPSVYGHRLFSHLQLYVYTTSSLFQLLNPPGVGRYLVPS